MKMFTSALFLALLIGIVGGSGSGCARRMTVATGTIIGLHATPGDGQSQLPQVTFAYKRAELALVPTAGKSASSNPNSDAFSALAIIDFRTKWFRGTSIDQFIATGHASRDIQEPGSEFTRALAKEGGRDFVVATHIYTALVGKAAAGDAVAAARVRDLDALSELVPGGYIWLEPIAVPPPPAFAHYQRRSGPTNPVQGYNLFTTYRQDVIGSISGLKRGPTLTVTELDNTTVTTLTGAALQRELGGQESAFEILRQRAAETAATSRALSYYIDTLKQ